MRRPIHYPEDPTSHDYFAAEGMLILEVDLTGLKASKSSEGSTKGYFSGERNSTGRQLVRVSARNYGELIFQKLYPGYTLSLEVLKETLKEAERLLGSGRSQRERTLLGLDGGFGTDENVEWLCKRGYHFVLKGYGGSRAGKLASSVPEEDWIDGPTEGQRLGLPEDGAAPRYSRGTKAVLRRWSDRKGKEHTDYLLTTFTHLDARGIATRDTNLRRQGGHRSGHKGGQKGLQLVSFFVFADRLRQQASGALRAYLIRGWVMDRGTGLVVLSAAGRRASSRRGRRCLWRPWPRAEEGAGSGPLSRRR